MKPKFAVAINCMDGRIQLPVIEYLKKKYGAEYIDIITEPGPIKYLDRQVNHAIIETIKKRVKISVQIHGAKVIAVTGHHDCAGNPVDKKTQIRQINESVKTIKKWGYDVEIIKLWINDKWKVEEV